MSYETWWIIHLYTYIAVAASFMHQVVNGQMFFGHPLNGAYWTALHVLMAFAFVYWRIGVPLVKSLKVNLKVEKVIVAAPGVISVIMKGRNLHTWCSRRSVLWAVSAMPWQLRSLWVFRSL